MKVAVELNNLDLVLLRRQKRHLVEINTGNEDRDNAVEGMLNLLDHVQDYIIDSGQATEEEVFGPRDADGRLDEAAEAVLQDANKVLHG